MFRTPHSTTTLVLVATASILAAATEARGVTISSSSTAPTVDGADIANLDLTNSFSDFGSSFMWPDRPARGQTFSTGSNTTGYTLDAFTFQAYTEGLETSNYTLRVGSISGTTFTPVATESGSFNVDIAANEYVTFTLDTPIPLAANTDYGFDVAITGSNGGFADHGWGPLNNAQTDFAGGTAYSSGGGGAGGPTISGHNQDRIFHLNLTANAVPEPSSIVLCGVICLCLASLGAYRTFGRNTGAANAHR